MEIKTFLPDTCGCQNKWMEWRIEGLWERVPPIRYRANIPTSWVRLTLIEGKNRQVRHMTAAVGFPTLRLIRIQIGNIPLGSLQPGEWRIVNERV